MKIGFNSETKEKEKGYSSYIGKYVRVISNGSQFYGRLISSNLENFTELKPSLVDYSTAKTNRIKLEKNIPTKISTSSISTIQPVNKKLLEDICGDIKSSNKSDSEDI